jgi:hypothetical protein
VLVAADPLLTDTISYNAIEANRCKQPYLLSPLVMAVSKRHSGTGSYVKSTLPFTSFGYKENAMRNKISATVPNSILFALLRDQYNQHPHILLEHHSH